MTQKLIAWYNVTAEIRDERTSGDRVRLGYQNPARGELASMGLYAVAHRGGVTVINLEALRGQFFCETFDGSCDEPNASRVPRP